MAMHRALATVLFLFTLRQGQAQQDTCSSTGDCMKAVDFAADEADAGLALLQKTAQVRHGSKVTHDGDDDGDDDSAGPKDPGDIFGPNAHVDKFAKEAGRAVFAVNASNAMQARRALNAEQALKAENAEHAHFASNADAAKFALEAAFACKEDPSLKDGDIEVKMDDDDKKDDDDDKDDVPDFCDGGEKALADGTAVAKAANAKCALEATEAYIAENAMNAKMALEAKNAKAAMLAKNAKVAEYAEKAKYAMYAVKRGGPMPAEHASQCAEAKGDHKDLKVIKDLKKQLTSSHAEVSKAKNEDFGKKLTSKLASLQK